MQPPGVRGFPALAGMDLRALAACKRDVGLPRARGDGPGRCRTSAAKGAASPRSRGWTPLRTPAPGSLSGFPALAGMDPSRRSGAPAGSRLPRARGDGPGFFIVFPSFQMASPRSRGWTSRRIGLSWAEAGFPALAGMDLHDPASPDSPARLPRARGDGPRWPAPAGGAAPASPRSRGWTRVLLDRRRAREGFPALAGMDLFTPPPIDRAIRLPRARGDGPPPPTSLHAPSPASPRSRGWTGRWSARRDRERRDRGGGFPALAGMDPPPSAPPPRPLRLPRARGDGPGHRGGVGRPGAASPRSRGWTFTTTTGAPACAGFPALAGMDPRASWSERRNDGLPRARGDGPARDEADIDRPGASPRSRGWTLFSPAVHGAEPGFPALAGMDPLPRRPARGPVGLPRARGDGPQYPRSASLRAMASPRSRGWTRARGAAPPRRGGFPALAGMDPLLMADPRVVRRLPRARGDGPPAASGSPAGGRASPRSRGWTHRLALAADRPAGFPALAGMDPTMAGRDRRGVRLPRARGDGPRQVERRPRRGAASPRSRGWTLRGLRGLRGLVGFPALAGMDPPAASGGKAPLRLPRARGDGPFAAIGRAVLSQASPRSRGWTRPARAL